MRADEVTAGRGRVLIVLVVAAAGGLMLGVLVMLAGLIMQLADKRSFSGIIEAGAVIAGAGMVFGLVLLCGYSLGRGLTGALRGFPNGRASHPEHQAYPPGRGDAAARFPQSPPPGYAPPGGFAQSGTGYGSPPGYAAPPGFARPGGQSMPSGHSAPQGPPAPPGYGPAPGFAMPQGYPAAPGHATPSGRHATPPGHAAPPGYGPPPGYPPPPAYGPPPGHSMPPGYGPSPAHAAPAANAGPDHRERERRHRPWQRGEQAPIDPTSIFSPGGLIGPPRDVRAPAPGDGAATGHGFGYAEPATEPRDDQSAWGDYAQVIHVDRPQPPRAPAAGPQAAPPAVPPEPELTDVFVYRDPEGAAQPEQDAAAAHSRGPFEPLRREAPAEASAGPAAAGQATAGPAAAGQAAPDPVPAGPEAGSPAPASRPPEQDTDRYAAAESASDEQTGRHFNGLLRRQRELITDYFKGPGISKPASFGAGDAGGAGEAGDEHMVASEQQRTD